MEVIGKLLGFLLFIAGAVGIYFLVKGKGRVQAPNTWAGLEKQYRVAAMPADYTTTSGIVGLGIYRNTLQLFLAEEGVYLNLPAVARGGSQPILIPYAEFVRSTTNPTVSRDAYEYTQFIVHGQSVCLSPEIAQKILARKQAIQP